MKHLLSIDQFSKSGILETLYTAQQFLDNKGKLISVEPILKGKTLVNCFFENSTRTRCSFEIAAKRLGATVINFDTASSSTQKGETLLDTIKTLAAMGADYFVVRHKENGIVEQFASQLPDVFFINAGDGNHAHPSQALLDMLTIQQQKPNLTELNVAIIGDIKHSRVANSAITALHILGVNQIRIAGPKPLLPTTFNGVVVADDLASALQDADVIMALRIQKERITNAETPNPQAYFQQFGLTTESIKHAKPNAIIMHPGPINRDIEIASEIADSSQSVILQQVTNGVAVRMAVLSQLR